MQLFEVALNAVFSLLIPALAHALGLFREVVLARAGGRALSLALVEIDSFGLIVEEQLLYSDFGVRSLEAS